jgi:sulfatase maturation enzyme AslB (radical SAM superfamily)
MTASYEQVVSAMRSEFMDYPAVVGFETIATCNAHCSFCDYPSSHRKGVRVDELLFERLINEISALPVGRRVGINLSGTSEPLADIRLFQRYSALERAHTGVESLLYTNGSLLTPKRVEELLAVRRWRRISVSLNAVIETEYESLMGLNFCLVAQGLDTLHRMIMAEKLPDVVVVTRVSAGTGDEAFRAYCNERWPMFRVKLRALMPAVGSGQLGNRPASLVGCSQWFKIHFLPDGREKLCCIDTHGFYASAMNLRETGLVTIYNSSWRKRLREAPVRLDSHPICSICERLV